LFVPWVILSGATAFLSFFFNGSAGVISSGAMRGLHFWDFMLSQRR
jgi:hypothetical protein